MISKYRSCLNCGKNFKVPIIARTGFNIYCPYCNSIQTYCISKKEFDRIPMEKWK